MVQVYGAAVDQDGETMMLVMKLMQVLPVIPSRLLSRMCWRLSEAQPFVTD
jgi:hypothetical protein